jgi:hypothetical protein
VSNASLNIRRFFEHPKIGRIVPLIFNRKDQSPAPNLKKYTVPLLSFLRCPVIVIAAMLHSRMNA